MKIEKQNRKTIAEASLQNYVFLLANDFNETKRVAVINKSMFLCG